MLALTFCVVFLLRQLRLPDIIGLLLIKVGEDEVEDFIVPFRGVTFDALFDVLS